MPRTASGSRTSWNLHSVTFATIVRAFAKSLTRAMPSLCDQVPRACARRKRQLPVNRFLLPEVAPAMTSSTRLISRFQDSHSTVLRFFETYPRLMRKFSEVEKIKPRFEVFNMIIAELSSNVLSSCKA